MTTLSPSSVLKLASTYSFLARTQMINCCLYLSFTNMAEVFGIVAGTLSFASIVMQLLDTVKKVSETWDLIKGASAEHQALSRRIKDVEALLQLLANKELDGPLKPIMESMLVKCGKQLGALQDQLVDLQEEPTTKRARMKKSLKIVFTAKRVEKMEGNLQALLGNLSMVVQAAQW